MTYSFTQISQYLACPRRYRYRYLDGWREKETRASMVFVLNKIDRMLVWERVERMRDNRQADFGRCFCEVRAG